MHKDFYEVKLIERTKITQDVYAFKFEKPSVSWSEGTNIHLTFHEYKDLALTDKTKSRHLSVNNLIDQSYLGFATRIGESSSDFKHKLLDLTAGDTVLVYKFTSRFKLRRENRPIIYLSMGIGISPLKPMIEAYLSDPIQITRMESINVSSPGYDYEVFLPSAAGLVSRFVHSKDDYYTALYKTYDEKAIYYIIGSDQFILDNVDFLHMKGHDITLIELDKKPDKKQLILNP